MAESKISAKANPALLLEQLRALVEAPGAVAGQRQEIIKLSRKAAVILEEPFETFQRIAYSALPLVTARVAQDHDIFKTLVDNKDGLISAKHLAERTGINPTVLDSLLDYLTTQYMVDEVSPGRYAPTKLSNLLLAPLFVDGVIHFHDNCLPAFTALIHYLRHPTDTRSAFEMGQNSPTGFYTWLDTHSVQSRAFHGFMEVQFLMLPSWLGVVPFDSEYGRSTTPATPLFVDVGGGNGQQVRIQDLKANDAVEYTAGLRLAMLVMSKALERKEGQWRKLLDDAGYQIRSITK